MARIIRESGTKESRRFKKFVTSSVISSIISAIVGVLIFLLAEQIGNFVGYIVGLVFIYTGMVSIYKYLKRDGAKLYSLNIIFGVLSILLGIGIIIYPGSVISYVNIALGVFLIITGGNKLTYGVWLKIGNDAAWSITAVSGAMLIIFGVLLIANPFEAFMTTTKLVGVFLILSSLIDLTTSVMLKQRSEEIVKIFW